MKIGPVGAEVFSEDRQTDGDRRTDRLTETEGQTHDEPSNPISQLCERALKGVRGTSMRRCNEVR